MSYLYPPPQPAPVVVTKDVGGFVSDYRERTAQFRAEQREVRLHECRSACTLALSLPTVCVYPSSLLKFHQAYNANTKETDLGITDELWRSYPSAVRARLGTLTRQYKVIKGDELISMGIRDCTAPKDNVLIAKAKTVPVPESDSMLAGLGDRLTSLVTPTAPMAVRTTPVVEPAKLPSGTGSPDLPTIPPEPPPRPSELTSTGVIVDLPLPPRRPPMLAKAEPAFRRPIAGAAKILPPVFVRLAAMR